MGWRHRYIQSRSVYEICFRAREGIPLPCTEDMNFLVECALAWALKGKSLKICHVIVMGNHIHLLVIVYDPEEFIRFYGELMKRLTDSVKRYTGRRHLRIWEGRAMVALVADPEACIERIKYFYLNPARAHLSESIDSYPGVSSWEAFSKCKPEQNIVVTKRLPQILMTDIEGQRKYFKKNLLDRAKDRSSLLLTYHPYAWISVFEQEEEELDSVKESIINSIREEEQGLIKKRAAENKKVALASTLSSQKVLAPFTPKKYGRKIFILSSIKELRISLIQYILHLTEQCKELYKRWKRGEYPITWPEGMFRPRAPLLVSLIG